MNNRIVVHQASQTPPITVLEDAAERRVVVHVASEKTVLRDSEGINLRHLPNETKSLIETGTSIVKIRQEKNTTITLITD